MKKTAIVLMVILCMVMAVGLTACSGGGQLDTPVVAISGNSLSWDPVDNASGYIVKLDNEVLMTTVDGNEQEQIITDTMYTFATDKKGVHTISVKAKGMGKFTDSEWSESMSFTVKEQLATPTLTSTREHNKITYTWNAIPGAVSYTIKIGLNLNETTAIPVPKENGTSYVIDVTESAYSEIGEYKAKVFAISDGGNYADSKGSNSVTYINTYKIKTPSEFKCDKDVFKWTKNDEQANKYKITAKREDGKEFSNETTGTSLSYANLRINEPGVYSVTVVAFSTGDSAVYLESDPTEAITITILPGVNVEDFKLTGTVLSWNPIAGASGYTITATTRNGVSFPISIEDGAATSYNLAENKDFRTVDRAGKMFTFEIVAEGKTSDSAALVFDSAVVSMAKGSYYQYLPNAADYDDAASRKDIIPDKVTPDNGGEAYYSIKTFPELMWALKNADANIVLANNIYVSNTEFVSPITSFSGKFIGNGHTISGIKMTHMFDRTSLSVFGDLASTTTIEDVVFAGVVIDVADADLKNGFIANKNNGTIDSVVVMAGEDGSGNIRLLNDTDYALIAYENNGTISNVIVNAQLQATNAAGIAVINNAEKSIINAAVYGAIKGVGVDKNVLVGTIVATNNGSITYSRSHASAFVNTASASKSKAASTMGVVGGIAAVNNGNIEYTYFTSGVSANCTNIAYAGGFVGINKGTISKSYVESNSSVTREDAVTLLGGFAGKNEGTIQNAYTSISFAPGYYETKAGFVADNATGTIKNVAFNQGKAGTANVVLEAKKGTVETAKGYQNNNLTNAVSEVLGDEFVVYEGFKSTVPVLKNVIYVEPAETIITRLEQDIDLLKYKPVDFKKYFVGGKEMSIPTEIDGKANEVRTNDFVGYQLVQYTANVGTAEAPVMVVFNRLIQVR